MPLLKITLSEPRREDVDVEAVMLGGSRAITGTMGKPEAFVMVTCDWEAMTFGGNAAPCALVELRSLGGLDAETNATLSGQLCELLGRVAGIPTERVFINFMNLERSDWGWNGRTFAS